MMRWYFLRHGEIESNLKKVYAGWNEEGLTPLGIRQATEAGYKLLNLGIEAIYCSPLRRTVETANIIGRIIGKKPICEDSFKELRLGIWEGMSEEEIAERFPEQWRIWNTKPAELILEGRETLHELLERVLNGIAKIGAKVRDKSVLIVTHVAIIRVLLLHSRGMSLNLYRTISVPNGQVFELETPWSVESELDERCHLVK